VDGLLRMHTDMHRCIAAGKIDLSSFTQIKENILMRAKFDQLKKKGQGLVEYALILVLIAIVVILILTFLGSKVNQTFSRIGSGLS
jgi:pilus assembly protein Flp/PilA